ncbi:hypothetical protein MRB53_005164 [Persea americana]|uniref:Uncharacterized protein n=1 Tax=Persea americana TaxID=3435 RepID=A0ACC2MDG2_PERAE|nr:hypothetical protein MRB53_005164 [Persea americana]
MAAQTTISDLYDNSNNGICSRSDTPNLSPVALNRLSDHLSSIFQSPDFQFCSDARIVAGAGREVPVHRCILSARSPFFRKIFSDPNSPKGRSRKLELKELVGDFDVGFDSLVSALSYLYSGKVRQPPDGVCVCVDDVCLHAACRPAVDFMVGTLYAAFTFQSIELVVIYQQQLLDILEKVETDDILVILSVANMCSNTCGSLLTKCMEIVVKSDIDIIALEKALPQDVVKKITDSRKSLGLVRLEGDDFPDKNVKRIHRALDSDDVELLRMLLKEAPITLDDAYALHYAVAYCDSKVTAELLDIELADVNHKNPRGYTVLHLAAMRRDPKIIVSLLTKGARPSESTSDGRNALQISKRLTKFADYYTPTEEGMASPKDRLCIEILEQAERRDPLLSEASVSLAMAGDDLRSKLVYLETRVFLAKLLFPTEAKVAMDIAQVEDTSELQLSPTFKLTQRNQSAAMDLNDAPFKLKEEHLARLRALSKTVELGKRFFPRCSAVLNKIMDGDGLSVLAHLTHETSEEQELKKQRLEELQNALKKAYNEDKEELDISFISSSSSSTSASLVQSKLI